MDRPNIVILTIGRCGSTVLAGMLQALGWRLPEADEYAEHVRFRQANELLLDRGVFDADTAIRLLAGMPVPWVLKDPRFVWTVDHWRPLLDGVLLLWLTRNRDDVERSLRKQRWGRDTPQGYTLRGKTLAATQRRCREVFDQWTGPKLHVDYAALRAAVRLFDTERRPDALPPE